MNDKRMEDLLFRAESVADIAKEFLENSWKLDADYYDAVENSINKLNDLIADIEMDEEPKDAP